MHIEKPTLLLDQTRAIGNIMRMAQKAARSGVRFRPHFKTHQSAVVGDWFRQFGVQAITVSSVDMARYFAGHGWQDITIAFPVNWLEIDKINELAGAIDLHLLVESPETVHFLGKRLAHPAHLWLKIDVGYGRTGLSWNEAKGLVAVAEAIGSAGPLTLQGLLTHSGHAYGRRPRAEVEAVYQETAERLQAARQTLSAAGWPGLEISVGDTPGCTLVEDLSAVDEIRPGNFVFYDYMQVDMGVCPVEDVAVALACPVVARHPGRGQIIIYGGAVHLSKEFIIRPDGRKSYGAVTRLAGNGWQAPFDDAYVAAIAQEHGQVQAGETLIEETQVGDLLLVLPIHSCLTANLRQRYLTLDGQIIEMAGIL